MKTQLKPDQLEYILQFQHPEKMLARLPGVNDRLVAAMFGVRPDRFRRIQTAFAMRARGAAESLLSESVFAASVDRLPFRRRQTVVGLGDSITDDSQSWVEILRYVLAIRRPKDAIRVVNAGISGDTTSQMISRFLDVVTQSPDWILCMAGTNDARRHGLSPTKTLVSIEETRKNLKMLRNFAATQSSARWVWMTPAAVIEEKIGRHWFLGAFQLQWHNRDLAAIARAVRRQPDPVVDLRSIYGTPARADWLLDDGLHPSLQGQMAIVRALVERLRKV